MIASIIGVVVTTVILAVTGFVIYNKFDNIEQEQSSLKQWDSEHNKQNNVVFSELKGNDRVFAQKMANMQNYFKTNALEANKARVNDLTLGDKWKLSGTGADDWLRFQDVTGENYYGGIAAKKMMITDDASFSNVSMGGMVNSVNGINITKNVPGPMLEKQYGTDLANRYGVGQDPNGQLRMYTAGSHGPATVNLSVANKDGTFDDIVKVKTDRSTDVAGRLNVKDNITSKSVEIANKWRLGDAGDDWLRLNSINNSSGDGYYGGFAANKMWTKEFTNAVGPTNLKGGSSEHNPGGGGTHFPFAGDNKNYIRGDTEIRGNTNNIGDITVGRNLNVSASDVNVYKNGDKNLGVTMFSTGKDGGSADVYNGGLASWNGIGFKSKVDGKTRFVHDTRTGNTSVGGDIIMENGKTLFNKGRQHIHGDEQLFLLNKGGVNVSKAWGGNGNLTVEGNTVLGGDTNINGKLQSVQGVRVVGDNPGPMLEKQYGTDLGNRYGMGQFGTGATRLYAANLHGPATVNLSLAKKDGSFKRSFCAR